MERTGMVYELWVSLLYDGGVVYLQGSQPQGLGSRRASRRSRSRSFRRHPPPHRPIYYSEVINQLERVTSQRSQFSLTFLGLVGFLLARDHGHARQRLRAPAPFSYCLDTDHPGPVTSALRSLISPVWSFELSFLSLIHTYTYTLPAACCIPAGFCFICLIMTSS